MKTMFYSAATLAVTTLGAIAQSDEIIGDGKDSATAVPEISALEGTAALAAVAAIVLLAWERRRRAS